MKKYIPGSGTEGMDFYEVWCSSCVRDQAFRDYLEGESEHSSGCEIIVATHLHKVEDEEYPSEWTYDEKGMPCCTGYQPDELEHPPHVMKKREEHGQLRLF